MEWFQVITGSQIRAARAAVNLSGAELAKKSGVSLRTVTKIEAFSGLPDARIPTIVKLKAVLESAGIEFIGTPDDGPGIRIYSRPSKT